MKFGFLNRTRTALAAIPVLVALLAGASAIAQTTSTTLLDPPKTVKEIRISGTPPMGDDSVFFDKQAVLVESTLSKDADPAVPPQLILDFKFLKFTGQAVKSKLKYISDNEIHLLKLLAPRHQLEVTFSAPEAKVEKNGTLKDPTALTAAESTQVLTQAPSFKVVFDLTFDPNGVLTGAAGMVAENTYTP